jgi:hypothetical protein
MYPTEKSQCMNIVSNNMEDVHNYTLAVREVHVHHCCGHVYTHTLTCATGLLGICHARVEL